MKVRIRQNARFDIMHHPEGITLYKDRWVEMRDDTHLQDELEAFGQEEKVIDESPEPIIYEEPKKKTKFR